MDNYQLIISPIAKQDLKEIYRFSLIQWGEKQANQYVDTIQKHLWLLASHPFIGSERPEILPSLRSYLTQKHILYYRIKEKHIEIVRILHIKQDPTIHLINR